MFRVVFYAFTFLCQSPQDDDKTGEYYPQDMIDAAKTVVCQHLADHLRGYRDFCIEQGIPVEEYSLKFIESLANSPTKIQERVYKDQEHEEDVDSRRRVPAEISNLLNIAEHQPSRGGVLFLNYCQVDEESGTVLSAPIPFSRDYLVYSQTFSKVCVTQLNPHHDMICRVGEMLAALPSQVMYDLDNDEFQVHIFLGCPNEETLALLHTELKDNSWEIEPDE